MHFPIARSPNGHDLPKFRTVRLIRARALQYFTQIFSFIHWPSNQKKDFEIGQYLWELGRVKLGWFIAKMRKSRLSQAFDRLNCNLRHLYDANINNRSQVSHLQGQGHTKVIVGHTRSLEYTTTNIAIYVVLDNH